MAAHRQRVVETQCPDCGGEPSTRSPWGRCRPCAATRREALLRVVKLRPLADRLSGAVQCMKRITSVAAAEDTNDPDWYGASYRDDFARLQQTLTEVEQQLDALADDWQTLLLTR